MKERVLIISLAVIAMLSLAVAVVFAFGTPQAPDLAPIVETTVSAPPMGAAAFTGGDGGDSQVTNSEVPPPDPGSPLAIEIPGCVCHSDDPVLVEEHADYRMNQCFGCHAGGMPEMGQ